MHSYRRTMMGSNKYESIDTSKYLTLIAQEDGFNFTFTSAIEYCLNGIANWQTLPANTTSPTLNTGEMISLRATLTPTSSAGIGSFTITKKCNLSGTAMSLIFGDNGGTTKSLSGKDYAFYRLFENCDGVLSVTSTFLPATTLAISCYNTMFSGCTSLTTAPALPATTLTAGCYFGMFQGCTSLTTAPALQATTLATSCYLSMFQGCTSLTTVSELPANTLAEACYLRMFSGCTKLTSAPALPATTLAISCYNTMFAGCTSLTTAPALPATTLVENCYYNMFNGCTGLTSASALSATTLANGCYNSMFHGCTSLTTAPALPATTLIDYCYGSMFAGCTSLTTAPELPATTLVNNCYWRMFYGCTSLTTAPELPATTLVNNCYAQMFYNCSKLNYINAAFTTNPGVDYTSGWVYGVASTGTFVKSRNATWTTTGANGVPTGWTIKTPVITSNYLNIKNISTTSSINVKLSRNAVQYSIDEGITWTTVSADTYYTIPAGKTAIMKGNITPVEHYGVGTINTTGEFSVSGNFLSLIYGDNAASQNNTDALPAYAFYQLFSDCKHLYNADNLFFSSKPCGNYCYSNMFYGCTGLTSVPGSRLPSPTLAKSCYEYMFQNCTGLTNIPSTYLQATALAESCYNHMFYGCTGLTSAPALPATTLVDFCYYGMFYDCTGLTSAPALPATTLALCCYSYMFEDCTGLTTPPTLPATTLAGYCYDSMFKGCTGLTTAPALPATTLKASCYKGMFQGCTALTTAPALPATTLDFISVATHVYEDMFNGCSKLNYIDAAFTTEPGEDYTKNWVAGVASTGTFVKSPYATWDVTGDNGVPTGWTVQQESTFDPNAYLTMGASTSSVTVKFNSCATSGSVQYTSDSGKTWNTLDSSGVTINTGKTVSFKGNLVPAVNNGCGTFTFTGSGKISLTGTVMALLHGDDAVGKTTLTNAYAFYKLFYSLTHIISVASGFLPATTLTAYCYSQMFYGCTSLTTAPALPATTLAVHCYSGMFGYCTSLTTSPALPATTLAQACYYNMFNTCTNLINMGNVATDVTLANDCCYLMFSGCTNLTSNNLKIAFSPTNSRLPENCYKQMFSGCSSLTTAPDLGQYKLNPTNSSCYGMFQNCTSLTTIGSFTTTSTAVNCYAYMFANTAITTTPALPATTLMGSCYQYMFYNCSKLIACQSLPAKTLALNCYGYMFYGCSKLNYINAAFTTTPGTGNTNNWVYGVASTGTFVKASDASWDVTGVHGVPTGWTVRGGQAFTPENYFLITNNTSAAIQITWSDDSDGYEYPLYYKYKTSSGSWSTSWSTLNRYDVSSSIPSGTVIALKGNYATSGVADTDTTIGCIEITGSGTGKVNISGDIMALLYGDEADAGGVTSGTIPANAFSYMFYYQQLIDIASGSNIFSKCNVVKSFSCNGMFQSCTGLTSAPALPATTLTENCYNYMFEGCTSLTTAPALPATTLADNCYESMFYGCTSLTTAPALPATTLAQACYNHMFYGCTGLTSAPALPATTLTSNCYYGMFYGCTSLTTAPALPATTLTTNCYNYMFYSCSKLNYINAAFTTTPTTTYTNNWVSGVASSGTFVKASDASWSVTGVHGVPTGWTIITSSPSTAQGSFRVTTSDWDTWTGTDNSGIPVSSPHDKWVSVSNKGVDDSIAKLRIYLTGCYDFTIYIRSNGENNWDYVIVGKPEVEITKDMSSNNTTDLQGHTKGKATSDTGYNSWTEVRFTNLSGAETWFEVGYRKDGTTSQNDDCGYLIIPDQAWVSGD